jgi:transcription antitermination factor NusA-like protein
MDTMKNLPVCKTCVGGTLCNQCQEKFDKGLISQFDIDLAKDFLELEQKFPDLKKLSFYNAVDTGNIVFLVVGGGQKEKFTKEILKEVKDSYELKAIQLIEKGPDKEMLEQIIAPAKLFGINRIYIPTGDTEYRVVISKEDKDKIKIPLNLLEKASSIIIRGIAKVEWV